MENNTYKLHVGAGDRFMEIAKQAKNIAKEKSVVVEFEFNEIICLVSDQTIIEWLERDYMNAHLMQWKTIGPKCDMSYSSDVEINLYTRRLELAKERKIREIAQNEKDKKEEQVVSETIKDIPIELIAGKEEEYKAYVENNKDGYGRAVIDFSEGWAKLMQLEIAKGRTVKDCAEETQNPLSYLGITGFQYGCAVQGLAHFWKHGEELRKWHNKEYGVDESKTGVVNPAVMTIGVKDEKN